MQTSKCVVCVCGGVIGVCGASLIRPPGPRIEVGLADMPGSVGLAWSSVTCSAHSENSGLGAILLFFSSSSAGVELEEAWKVAHFRGFDIISPYSNWSFTFCIATSLPSPSPHPPPSCAPSQEGLEEEELDSGRVHAAPAATYDVTAPLACGSSSFKTLGRVPA